MFALKLALSTLFLTSAYLADAQEHLYEFDAIESGSNQVTFQTLLSKEILLESERAVQNLVKSFPPQKYHYVFVGRSLSLINIIMTEQGYETSELPISGKHYNIEYHEQNKPEKNQQLKKHTLKHLEKINTQDSKNIVLLDFTISGRGLALAHSIVSWVYQKNKKIYTFEVTGEIEKHKRFNFTKNKTHFIDPNSEFLKHLKLSNFDYLSNHPSFATYNMDFRSTYGPSERQFRVEAQEWIRNKSAFRLQCSSFLN